MKKIFYGISTTTNKALITKTTSARESISNNNLKKTDARSHPPAKPAEAWSEAKRNGKRRRDKGGYSGTAPPVHLALLLFTVIFFLLPSPTAAQTNYWQRLKRAADACYSGFDLDLKFEIGAVQTNTFSESEIDQFGKLVFSLPLLSRNERLKRNADRRAFIEAGADLIRTIEESERMIAQKGRYLSLLQKVAGEEGMAILEKALAINTEIITIEAQRTAAIRKLEGYFKCSRKLTE